MYIDTITDYLDSQATPSFQNLVHAFLDPFAYPFIGKPAVIHTKYFHFVHNIVHNSIAVHTI